MTQWKTQWAINWEKWARKKQRKGNQDRKENTLNDVKAKAEEEDRINWHLN